MKDILEAYLKLSEALNHKLVDGWKKDEKKAYAERGEALRIYKMQLEQGINYNLHL